MALKRGKWPSNDRVPGRSLVLSSASKNTGGISLVFPEIILCLHHLFSRGHCLSPRCRWSALPRGAGDETPLKRFIRQIPGPLRHGTHAQRLRGYIYGEAVETIIQWIEISERGVIDRGIFRFLRFHSIPFDIQTDCVVNGKQMYTGAR